MTKNEEQSYINGINFALKQVADALKSMIHEPDSQTFIGTKLVFLEPIREMQKKLVEQELKLKELESGKKAKQQ